MHGNYRRPLVLMRALAAIVFAISAFSSQITAVAAPRLAVVATDRCVMTDWPPPEDRFLGALAFLGPILLPRLFDSGMGFASGRLRAAAAQRAQITEVGQTSGYFLEMNADRGVYAGHSDLTCLIVAHGEIEASGTSSSRLDAIWSAKSDALVNNGLVFKDNPNFYYEGLVQFSEDGQSFKIRSGFIYYDGSLRSSRKSKATRELAIAFSFEDGAGRPFAESAMPLSGVEAGVVLDAEALGVSINDIKRREDLERHARPQFETNWMAALGPDEASVARLVDDCTKLGCPRVVIPVKSSPASRMLQAQPYTLKVHLTESSEPNAILTFLADTIDASRPIAATSLASQFLPQDIFDPGNPEWWLKRQTAYEACNSYRAAQEALAAAPFDPARRAAVNIAYSNLQAAYADAGLPTLSLYADTALNCRLSGG